MPEHRVGLDGDQGLITDADFAVHGETDLGGLAGDVEFNGIHVSHGVSVDLYRIAVRDAGGMSEVGGVVTALGPERQPGVTEGHQHQARDDSDAENAGTQRISATRFIWQSHTFRDPMLVV